MSTIADTTFKTSNTKLYVPYVTLSSKNNVKLVKVLEKAFKTSVYWNEQKTKIETRNLDIYNLTKVPLDGSFQGIRRFFVLAFNNTTATVPDNPINNTSNKVLRKNHKIFSSKNKYNLLQRTNRRKKLL